MKTTVFIISLFIGFYSDCKTQTLFYPTVKWQPAVEVKNNVSSQNSGSITNTIPIQNTSTWKLPAYDEPIQRLKTETRVTAYYEEGYGTNLIRKKISLKVTIETNSMGQDEINVIAYMDYGYWISVSYGGVSKTYGEIAKEFSYSTYVASKTVYFNI